MADFVVRPIEKVEKCG